MKCYSPADHTIVLQSAFTSTALEKDSSEKTQLKLWLTGKGMVMQLFLQERDN